MLQDKDFDPIKRSEDVEKLVMQGDKRLYYKFRVQEFYGGVATADTIGCNLLCAYCWNYSRNLNPDKTNGAKFFSPLEVAKKLDTMHAKRPELRGRISGAEPFLGETSAHHLAKVLELCHISNFIIETNGVMLGYNPGLVDLIKPFRPYVRLTIKGDGPKQFEKVTGAHASAFEYQINAYDALKRAGVRVGVAIMPQFVNKALIQDKVRGKIETEDLRFYSGTTKRIEERKIRQRSH